MLKKKKKTLKSQGERGEVLFVGSAEEQERVAELQRQVNDVSLSTVDYVAVSEGLMVANDKHQQDLIASSSNIFQKRMMFMCAAPLLRGVSPNGVVQSLGMFMAMRAVSPDFRDGLDASVRHNLETFCKNIEDKMDRGEKIPFVPSGPAQTMFRNGVKSIHKNSVESRGGQLPMTPDSAAIVSIGLTKNAFNEMRVPDANPIEVSQNLDRARENLYKLAAQDGISVDDILAAEKMMIGSLHGASDNFTDRQFYAEMAQRGIRRGPGSIEQIEMICEDSGQVYMTEGEVWRGEYVRSDGETPYTGVFSPRHPMGGSEVSSEIKQIIDTYCADDKINSVEDFQEFAEASEWIVSGLYEPDADIPDELLGNKYVQHLIGVREQAYMGGVDGLDIDAITERCVGAFQHRAVAYGNANPSIVNEWFASSEFNQTSYTDDQVSHESEDVDYSEKRGSDASKHKRKKSRSTSEAVRGRGDKGAEGLQRVDGFSELTLEQLKAFDVVRPVDDGTLQPGRGSKSIHRHGMRG